ncbi:MAG: Riboflavin transporter [Candidatus Anoxychlamydiales bacterium]|nr:Riboflavin transporter [Candidatus Anoxychlamydiales bacterium]NGX36585.1 Riboflavin transporter [Candidatus Anoxychlamydiales bacterium]
MKIAPAEPNLTYGIIVTLGAYLCFSIVAAIVRSFNPSFPTMEILFFQSLISLIIVMPIFIKRKLYKVQKKLIPLHLVRSVSGVASFFCYFFAIKKMNLIDASVLTYTAPFYTPLIWLLWTKEKIEKGVWWTIILGFIGIALILKPSNHLLKIGSFIGISAGVLASVALVSIKLLNQKMECLTRTLFFYFLLSTLLTLPFAILYWQTPNKIEILFLVSIGLVMALAQLFLTTAYKHGTAAFLSPISYSAIIFTAFLSWIIFKQPPGYLTVIGAILIIIGGSISYIIKIKPTKLIQIFEHSEEEKIHLWQTIRINHHHIEIHKHKKNNKP